MESWKYNKGDKLKTYRPRMRSVCDQQSSTESQSGICPYAALYYSCTAGT